MEERPSLIHNANAGNGLAIVDLDNSGAIPAVGQVGNFGIGSALAQIIAVLRAQRNRVVEGAFVRACTAVVGDGDISRGRSGVLHGERRNNRTGT